MSATLNETRLQAEAEFERSLREYILNPRGGNFMYGGVCNVLAIIATICKEQSDDVGDDWEIASEKIAVCSFACDLKYESGR